MTAGLTIAVVGLGFGRAFVPIYLSHPDVATVILVDPDTARRTEFAALYGLPAGHDDIRDALADPAVDAVHILTPVHLHADMVVAALEAGKHVACAVPMATTLPDIDRIIAAQVAADRTYMMMETTVFAREYFAVRDMYTRGTFGDLTLYRGFHVQHLDGYPSYWQGFPPMHYLTHALSPLLALLDATVQSVQCQGAGRLADHRRSGGFDNPFPTEVGLFRLRDSDVLADIQMSFSQTARGYVEGFSLYGERRGVEWPIDNTGPLTVFDLQPPADGQRGNPIETSSLTAPDRTEWLPEPLRRFVMPSRVRLPGMSAEVEVDAQHGGAHPFLVDEFVRSVIDARPPIVDARRSAAWTAPGIAAHASALAGGAATEVPDYRAVGSAS